MRTTINGNEYNTGRLSAFEQLHIARRLAPALANLFTIFSTAPTVSEGESVEDAILSLATGPLADTFAKMSDTDVDYIVNTCLGVCERQQDKGFDKVMRGGTLMFHNLELDELLGLTFTVIQENLGRFFPSSQPE